MTTDKLNLAYYKAKVEHGVNKYTTMLDALRHFTADEMTNTLYEDDGLPHFLLHQYHKPILDWDIKACLTEIREIQGIDSTEDGILIKAFESFLKDPLREDRFDTKTPEPKKTLYIVVNVDDDLNYQSILARSPLEAFEIAAEKEPHWWKNPENYIKEGLIHERFLTHYAEIIEIREDETIIWVYDESKKEFEIITSQVINP